jgi:3-hydroxyisobutyrate dehydrogenase-like beta-hydroxyacid dehydrogenase
MGLPMALNLIGSGFEVTGFSLAGMEKFAAAGGRTARSPREAASGKEVVIACLPGSAAVLDQVLDGPDGLLAGLRPGAILIETSTHPIEAKREAADRLAKLGATFLECEITGVPPMVAARRCVFFISGGTREAYERCLPVLDAITATEKRYLGSLGTATKMKLVNNLLTCVHIAAAAEVLALGMKVGLRPDDMLALFGAGAGSSAMFVQRGPLMIERKFDQSEGPFDSLAKLPPAIQALAADAGAATPMLDAAALLYEKALVEGRGPQDVAAMIEIIESLGRGSELTQVLSVGTSRRLSSSRTRGAACFLNACHCGLAASFLRRSRRSSSLL